MPEKLREFVKFPKLCENFQRTQGTFGGRGQRLGGNWGDFGEICRIPQVCQCRQIVASPVRSDIAGTPDIRIT